MIEREDYPSIVCDGMQVFAVARYEIQGKSNNEL